MGSIRVPVSIENPSDPDKAIRCDAVVDTGASHMTLPTAWRDRLGDLEEFAKVKLVMATQTTVDGAVCGPVRVQIEGFRPIATEVAFVAMEPVKPGGLAPDDGRYEPLIGSIVLEQSQAAVDMMGDRLVHAGALHV